MEDGGNVGVEVAKSVVASQAKAQLRIALAGVAGAIAGSAFGHRFIPPGMIDDKLVDAVSVLIIYGATMGWTWARTKIVHSVMWQAAQNPTMPNVTPKP